MLVVLALFGFVVGVLSALFGIGGGVVMVPFLRMALSLAAPVASATSLAAILPTSVVGAWARSKSGDIDIFLGTTIGLSGVLSAPLGAWLAGSLPGWIAMAATSVLMLGAAVSVWHRMRHPHPQAHQSSTCTDRTAALSGSAWQSHSRTVSHPRSRTVTIGLCLGVIAGFLSGYLGIGGGFVIVPLLIRFFNLSIQKASATSLVSIAILGIPGCIVHTLMGHVLWLEAGLLIVGSVLGAQVGAWVAIRLDTRRYTQLFVIVLMIFAVSLVLYELKVGGYEF